MFGILALVCFVLAVLFHGTGFDPNAWLNWTGVALAGLAFLTLHLLGVAVGMPVVVRRRSE